jgi:hypothetical protein
MRAVLHWLGVASCVFFSLRSRAQDVETILKQMSTAERVRTHAWWPTKGLDSDAGYVGPEVCAKCHVPIAKTQRLTAMAQALMPVGRSNIVGSQPRSFELGAFRYSIRSDDKDVVMNVSNGSGETSVTLQWAFGSGIVGQSYVWKQGSDLMETRFNYFGKINSFDWAPGRLHSPPQSLEMAVGRPISAAEAGGCLRCHATAVPSDLDMSKVVPGITCEACHGPGAKHVAAQKSGTDPAGLILNPARLPQADATDFCGSCHSSFWDVTLTGHQGIATVRSPGYRLEKSKCWKSDKTLTCTTCHDPHQPVAHDVRAYDAKCQGCHNNRIKRTSAKHIALCKVSTSNCASCHMPKYELPEMHSKFTDHNVRVAPKAAFVE